MALGVCAPLALHIRLGIFNAFVEQCSRNSVAFMYVDLFLDLVAKCISLSLSHIYDETLIYYENYYITILHCGFSLIHSLTYSCARSLSPSHSPDSFCVSPAQPPIISISETEQ